MSRLFIKLYLSTFVHVCLCFRVLDRCTFYLYILSISHLSIYSKIYVVYSCYKFQTMRKMHNLLYVKSLIIKVFDRIYVINPLMLFHPPNEPNSHHKPYPNTSPTIPTHDHQLSAVVLIRCL